MRAEFVSPIVASTFVALCACQTSGPVYRTYYLPGREITNATALVRAAETRCNNRAIVEAQDAYDRAYHSVNVPRPSGNTTSEAPQGLALSPTESAALVASRMATVQAQQAQRETWDSAMKACMLEAGFRQVTVCVSACSQ